MNERYELDLETQESVVTGASDVTLTVPVDPPMVFGLNPQDTQSLYFLIVTGSEVYVNVGAVATDANAQLSIGPFNGDKPHRLPPGQVIHFLGTATPGKVSIIRARIAS